jgi:hypothetical protein
MRWAAAVPAVLLGLAGPVSAQHPTGLDATIAGPSVIRRPATACDLAASIDQLARTIQMAFGVEAEGCRGRTFRERDASECGAACETIDLTGRSGRTVLDQLVEILPDYEWRELDGVIVVRRRAAWHDATNVLHRQVGPVTMHGTAGGIVDAVLNAATPSLVQPYQRVPGADIEPPFPIAFAGGTFLDALNAVVRGHSRAGWELAHDQEGNLGTLWVTTLDVGARGVMAPVRVRSGGVSSRARGAAAPRTSSAPGSAAGGQPRR